MHWDHRIFEHRNSIDAEHEIYFTVQEVYYGDDGLPEAFTQNASSPQSKVEAQQIVTAFDKPVVGWLDDAAMYTDEYGFDDYRSWGWLVESTKRPSLKNKDRSES